mmetsp:Transcript_25148/g.86124  ORF Transcript_25148/g.86124 Transcript_25148/m.86124 type:complete len:377 (-) Transcript_25148:2470-3600(-)
MSSCSSVSSRTASRALFSASSAALEPFAALGALGALGCLGGLAGLGALGALGLGGGFTLGSRGSFGAFSTLGATSQPGFFASHASRLCFCGADLPDSFRPSAGFHTVTRWSSTLLSRPWSWSASSRSLRRSWPARRSSCENLAPLPPSPCGASRACSAGGCTLSSSPRPWSARISAHDPKPWLCTPSRSIASSFASHPTAPPHGGGRIIFKMRAVRRNWEGLGKLRIAAAKSWSSWTRTASSPARTAAPKKSRTASLVSTPCSTAFASTSSQPSTRAVKSAVCAGKDASTIGPPPTASLICVRRSLRPKRRTAFANFAASLRPTAPSKPSTESTRTTAFSKGSPMESFPRRVPVPLPRVFFLKPSTPSWMPIPASL